MDIASISHKGLKDFIEKNDARGLNQNHIARIRRVIAQLVIAQDMDGVEGPPGWRIHQLKGDRAGVWSISITGNWRITFAIVNGKITDLDLEDYH
ncbi:MAG: type II toxin-antitoxin system RelE/ParE family toxin [Chloroflexota bacterium]